MDAVAVQPGIILSDTALSSYEWYALCTVLPPKTVRQATICADLMQNSVMRYPEQVV